MARNVPRALGLRREDHTPVVDGDASPLVRPYLLAYELAAEHRERRAAEAALGVTV